MRLGETVTLMVQGSRALPQEVSRITQAINRFRPLDQQLDESTISALDLLAALEQLDPAIKEVVKNITIETVEDAAMSGDGDRGEFVLKGMNMGKRMMMIVFVTIVVLVGVNMTLAIYLQQDSETARVVLQAFVEIIKAFLGVGTM